MVIKVNGLPVTDAGPLSVADLLSRHNFVAARVAVECNGAIVPRTQYAQRLLADGDAVEIVCFVGGG